MDELHGRRLRRRRAPGQDTPAEVRESAESVLPDLPRVGALDALLREVDSLRLSLETDLTLAAAAVESGQPQLACEIIDSDRDGLRAFEGRALGHLEDLAAPTRRFRVPAAPFVAAAAVAGFLLGVVPHTAAPSHGDATTNVASESPTESLLLLQQATSNGDAAQALEAANILHGQLTPILLQAQTDPVAAAKALALLNQEQHLLAGAVDTPALAAALATSRQLTSKLQSILKAVPAASPTVPVVVPASPAPANSPKPASSPKATSSPAPKPKPTTAPKPTSSPAPSSSPTSDPGPLPGAPGFS